MKKLTMLLALVLSLALLAGCAGTPVIYYTNCTCPAGTPGNNNNTDNSKPPVVADGDLEIGLAIATGLAGSKSGEKADFAVTVAAVAVDKNGVIVECILDGIAANAAIDATGAITSDVTAPVQTKNELGDKYGMVNYAGAIAEWNVQADRFAKYVIGKTAQEVLGIAVNEAGKPADADIATSVTIAVGEFKELIAKAAQNAKAMGTAAGDSFQLGITASLASSKAATADKQGIAQLDVDVAVLTMDGETITGCYIDAVQAKVEFDATGTITTDLSKPVQTKNELGESYGMMAWGGAIAEWNTQAEAFCEYVQGKTVAQVKGIAVTEGGKPADADLAASVTIAIGGFQALIEKAAK